MSLKLPQCGRIYFYIASGIGYLEDYDTVYVIVDTRKLGWSHLARSWSSTLASGSSLVKKPFADDWPYGGRTELCFFPVSVFYQLALRVQGRYQRFLVLCNGEGVILEINGRSCYGGRESFTMLKSQSRLSRARCGMPLREHSVDHTWCHIYLVSGCSLFNDRDDTEPLQDFESLGTSIYGNCCVITKQNWAAWGLSDFFFGQSCARCNNSGSHGVMLK